MIPNCIDISEKTVGFLLAVVLTWSQLAAAEGDPFTEILQPAFQNSCVECHGAGDDVKAELSLLEFQSADDLTRDLDLLRELIDVLEREEMPPEEKPPLEPGKRQQLVKQLQNLLHAAVSSRKIFPHIPIRRMNRFQYSNAVEDLLELKVEVFALPERMMRAYGYFKPETGKMPDNLRAGSRPLGKSQLINKRLSGVAPFPQDLRGKRFRQSRRSPFTLAIVAGVVFQTQSVDRGEPRFQQQELWHLGDVFCAAANGCQYG